MFLKYIIHAYEKHALYNPLPAKQGICLFFCQSVCQSVCFVVQLSLKRFPSKLAQTFFYNLKVCHDLDPRTYLLFQGHRRGTDYCVRKQHQVAILEITSNTCNHYS